MTENQFCYWLKGYFELANPRGYAIDHMQTKIIMDHLDQVFKKETPDRISSFKGDGIKFC